MSDVLSGAFNVISAGSYSGLVISGGTILDVRLDATVTGTLVYDPGADPGSEDTFLVLGGGGVLGGDSFSTVVSYGGEEFVESGGTSFGATLNDGGGQWVLEGGVSVSATVNSGGNLLVADNASPAYAQSGVISATTIEPGGTAILESGATAIDADVLSGGTLVYQGGITTGVISGGTLIVEGDQTTGGISPIVASGIAIAGAQLIVSSGGSALATAVGPGANDTILSGGVASGSVVSAGPGHGEAVSAGGTTVATVLLSGGTQLVTSGGTASGTVISSGGQQAVKSGGTAIDTSVLSGGIITFAGGSVIGLSLSSGAAVGVGSGNTISGLVVSSGGSFIVFSGGTAFATTVQNGGNEYVAQGGFDSGATIQGGGSQGVASGGTALGGLVTGSGGVLITSGGLISGGSATEGGDIDVIARGVVSSARIDNGGFLINSGGTDVATYVGSGGENETFGGLASATDVGDFGVQYVSAGGASYDTHVESNGKETVSAGGVANETTVDALGIILVKSGGTAVSATLAAGSRGAPSGGTVLVYGGTLDVYAGGVASATTLDANALELVMYGGTEIGATVLNDGTLLIAGTARGDIANGGTLAVAVTGVETGAIVVNGGTLLTSGGVDIGTVINSGGAADVEGTGGVASGATVNDQGDQTVSAGASSYATAVFAGGAQTVDTGGTANLTIVNNEGELVVSSGGFASNTILEGGNAYIAYDGTIQNTTVEAGSVLTLTPYGGAIVSGLTVLVGGTLDGDGKLYGTIRIDGTAEVSGGTLEAIDGLTGTGVINVDSGSTLEIVSGSTISDVHVSSGGDVQIDGVTLTTDPITIDAGGSITGTGILGGAIADDGGIFVTAGLLELTGPVTGPGKLTIGNGGTLLLDGAVAAGTTVEFTSGGTGTLELAAGVAPPATILGMTAADKVITVACFAAGTRIATPAGDIPVEALRPGDRVLTVHGAAPVVWTGWRSLKPGRHPRPWDVRPVRVRAGAFGPGQPLRDLVLSPDHAILVEGNLIPVRYLMNGKTIIQQNVADITYFHVELSAHDILLAEGLPCESYLDTGNRSEFANAGPVISLHADFAPGAAEVRRYAPLVLAGPAVIATKTRLLAEAETLGHALTADPALRLLADGDCVPSETSGRTWRASLPIGPGRIRLRSRTWVPAHTRPHEDDTRTLGIAIGNLRADGRPLRLDDARLTSGWQKIESCKAQSWRWTNGDAGLALPGVRTLQFDVVMTGQYWRPAGARGPRRRAARSR